jgi:hypothetical protein
MLIILLSVAAAAVVVTILMEEAPVAAVLVDMQPMCQEIHILHMEPLLRSQVVPLIPFQ